MLCGHQKEPHVSTLTNEKPSHTTDNDFQALDSAWTAFNCYKFQWVFYCICTRQLDQLFSHF